MSLHFFSPDGFYLVFLVLYLVDFLLHTPDFLLLRGSLTAVGYLFYLKNLYVILLSSIHITVARTAQIYLHEGVFWCFFVMNA